MNIEKVGHLDFGFILNEQNIRRIVSTSKEQLDKITEEKSSAFFDYLVKLENGSVINEILLDEVLLLENHGTIAVREFRFKFSSDGGKNIIEVIYSKIRDKKILYYISSSDRDWVFVTMSLIKEKIELTRRNKMFYLETNNFKNLFLVSALCFIFSFMLMFLYQSYLPENKCFERYKHFDYTVPYSFVTDRLEKELKGRANISFTEAILVRENIMNEYKDRWRELALERDNKIDNCNKSYDGSIVSFKKQKGLLVYVCLGFTLFVYCYSYFMSRFYPSYVFCWGAEEDSFLKIETQRKFILGTIVTGLLISIIAGTILNSL